ncbi:MAG: TlpA family protein disulfide reductase [Oligoflexales bacterium]
MKIFIVTIGVTLSGANLYGGRCFPIKVEQFERVAEQKKWKEVVFFASWCASCKPHLIQATSPRSVVIATYDTRQEAERVLDFLGIQSTIPCFIDHDGKLREKFKIQSLPRKIMLSDQSALKK